MKYSMGEDNMSKNNSSTMFRLKGRLKANKKSVLAETDTPEQAEIRNRGYEKIMSLIDRFKG